MNAGTDKTDNHGYTAMHSVGCNPEAIQLLLDKGAEENHNLGKTSLGPLTGLLSKWPC